MALFDVSSARSKQFTQEVRLQSDFSGPFNFSIGGNFTKFKTQNDYYVMGNILTLLAMVQPMNGSGSQSTCAWSSFFLDVAPQPLPIENSFCPYIDPNSVENINVKGHTYFRRDRKNDG